MWNRLKSNSVKAGLGAFALAIANLILQIKLTPEGGRMTWLSPSGISIIILFVLGGYLVLSSVFGHESSFAEKEAVVKQRQENLPLLRSSIDGIIKRQGELALEMGKIPLQRFFDEYLRTSRQYKLYRKLLTYHTSDNVTKHKVATLATMGNFFVTKPICFNNAARDDEQVTSLVAEKDIYYHRNNDRILSGRIDDLLLAATRYHSTLAFTELATNNQLSYTSLQKYVTFEEKPEILKGFMRRAYKTMNDRMEFLMRGGDL